MTTTTLPALTPVESSNIGAIGYDEMSQQLFVQYRGGRTYRYFDVPQQEYAKLWEDGISLGSHIHNAIKPMYRCEPVEPPEEERDE